MYGNIPIAPPEHPEDLSGAQRVFTEFLDEYQLVLVGAERYFKQILSDVEPDYARAYTPWHHGARELLDGVYRTANGSTANDTRDLANAIRLFSLDSSAEMLEDICQICKMNCTRHWKQNFLGNITALSAAFRILYITSAPSSEAEHA